MTEAVSINRELVKPRAVSSSRMVGVVAFIGLAAGGATAWFWWQSHTTRSVWAVSYLVSYLFWLGISLGSLALTMLHHLTGGNWGVAIRRITEAAATPLPLMALLFLPIAVSLPDLYPWAVPGQVAMDLVLQKKSGYLNAAAFFMRAGGYFVLWSLWAGMLNGLAKTGDPTIQRSRQRQLSILSGVGLAIWGLTVTFAAVDWVMSLEPHWYSSIYGVLFMAAYAVSAMAFAILVSVSTEPSTAVENRITQERLHDLGNLLLALVVFWAYVSFMQFLIIWSGNLPEETPWYELRRQHGWQWLAVMLIVLHFLAPLLLLMMRTVKRHAARLGVVALLLLAMRVGDLVWLAAPPLVPSWEAATGTQVPDRGSLAQTILVAATDETAPSETSSIEMAPGEMAPGEMAPSKSLSKSLVPSTDTPSTEGPSSVPPSLTTAAYKPKSASAASGWSLWRIALTLPAIGGIWWLVFFWQFKRRASLPIHRALDEAAGHESSH